MSPPLIVCWKKIVRVIFFMRSFHSAIIHFFYIERIEVLQVWPMQTLLPPLLFFMYKTLENQFFSSIFSHHILSTTKHGFNFQKISNKHNRSSFCFLERLSIEIWILIRNTYFPNQHYSGIVRYMINKSDIFK